LATSPIYSLSLHDALPICDDHLALSLGVLAEAHHAVDLGDDGVLLGLARLEQLGHAGQTAGDVFRLGGLAGDLGDDLAGVDLLRSEEHTSELQSPCNLVCR